MPYEVRYTTDHRPIDLPEGAEVIKVSAFPYRFNAEGSFPTEVEVTAGGEEGIVACIWARDEIDDQVTTVSLSAAQARRLRDGLTEVLEGEFTDRLVDLVTPPAKDWDGYSEPPESVLETRDVLGRLWSKQVGGTWRMDSGLMSHDWDDFSGPGEHGPHIPVTFA